MAARSSGCRGSDPVAGSGPSSDDFEGAARRTWGVGFRKWVGGWDPGGRRDSG